MFFVIDESSRYLEKPRLHYTVCAESGLAELGLDGLESSHLCDVFCVGTATEPLPIT